MRGSIWWSTNLLLMLLVGCVTVRPAAVEPYDLYLLIGQSNMAGRGEVEEIDRTAHERVLMLNTERQWVVAIDPMHFDKPDIAGVGPGLSFGKAMAAEDSGRVIGLIPAAVGGSAIATWTPGSIHRQTMRYPYDDAIARARIAMRSGTLKGILWHQGEADSHADGTTRYQAALIDLVARIRHDLKSPNVPFIVGGLADFLVEEHPESATITAVLQKLTERIAHYAFVSADGLTHNGDHIHFSAMSARELGKRFAAEYIELRSASQ